MILGITGMSGVGKHVAADFFEKQGWVIVDADQIAHHLYRPYTYVWKAIVKRFGETILTKEDLIDRQKLRARIFNPDDLELSQKAFNDLNKIIHPELKRALKEKIHRHFRRKSKLVIVTALWKAMDLFKLCDQVLLVESDPDKAFMRLKKRDGMNETMYDYYTAQQERPKHPDFTVQNNEDLSVFERNLSKALSQMNV